MGGVFGLLIGLLVLRLRAAYLALFTLGFAEILKATISAEIEVTRGQAGMELPALFENGVTVLGHTFSKTDKLPPYFVMFALLLVCLAILAWLASSRFGLFVRALREDQDAAAALGVNTTRYKVLVFVITTMIAAAAGAVQGHYVGIVTPNSLFLLQMSLVVAMAVIGGVESFVAAAIGANGVGKSTALKAAFGFLTPNSGDILLEGESLLDIPTHRRILKGLAYIPQQPGVFRDMSVEENLELGGWTFRRDRKQVRDKIEANYERFPVLKEIEKADCGRAVRRAAAHGRDRTYVDVGSEDAAGGRTDRRACPRCCPMRSTRCSRT